MLQAEPSSWPFADEGGSLNVIQEWKEGVRDIQGGLAQKVRLIKWREVTREPGLPHIPSSNTLTHARSDKKKIKY